jgi:hypothetical protein
MFERDQWKNSIFALIDLKINKILKFSKYVTKAIFCPFSMTRTIEWGEKTLLSK